MARGSTSLTISCAGSRARPSLPAGKCLCMQHKIPSGNTRGPFRCCWNPSPTSNTEFGESLIPVGKLSAGSSSEILPDKRRGSSAGSRASSLSVSDQLINQTSVCFYFVLSKFISIIVTVNTLIRELSWEH